MRRAKVYEQLDKLDEALEDYKKIVELDPTASDARRACAVGAFIKVYKKKHLKPIFFNL